MNQRHKRGATRILPISVLNHCSIDEKSGNVVAHSEERVQLEVTDERRIQAPRQHQYSSFLERILLHSRVLIIEGIAGSGKDSFQTYLKNKLTNRDVYEYSEGELLQSWNQLQIGGIFKLRVKLMKLFVNYVKDVLTQQDNAVFLLNRFHLSAYVLTIVQQPKLEREYDEILNVLRTLPVHVFILQLDENEIEKRSLHPERSGAWQKFQEEIVKKEGFRDRLERYLWQQRLMLEAAETQRIPYSVLKFSSAREIATGWVRAGGARGTFQPGAQSRAGKASSSSRFVGR